MLPLPPHNIILFVLDIDVKFPFLRLLQCLSNLKSTITGQITESFHIQEEMQIESMFEQYIDSSSQYIF